MASVRPSLAAGDLVFGRRAPGAGRIDSGRLGGIWQDYFDVVEIVPACIGNAQDLVVMRARWDPGRPALMRYLSAPNYSFSTIAETNAPIASDEVSPGESMPAT
jgi:hypothetical protein